MIVVIGLVVFAAAVIVAVAGVFANGGAAHGLTDNFSVFGYHVTGSTGLLFLYGIVVGGVGMLGLSVLLAGARRTARRGATARRDLKVSRHNTAVMTQDRDDLADQRDRLDTAHNPAGGATADAPGGDAGPTRHGAFGRLLGRSRPVDPTGGSHPGRQ